MSVKTYHSDTAQTSQRFHVFCVLDVILIPNHLHHYDVRLEQLCKHHFVRLSHNFVRLSHDTKMNLCVNLRHQD